MIGPIIIPYHGQLYGVRRVYPEADEFKLAWELVREKSELRTVRVIGKTTVCDCPDFELRKQSMGLVCRHIEMLTKVGLLPKRNA